VSQQQWEDIQAAYYILTDPASYGTMDQEVLYLFGGIGLVLTVSMIWYFKALNQYPAKGDRHG